MVQHIVNGKMHDMHVAWMSLQSPHVVIQEQRLSKLEVAPLCTEPDGVLHTYSVESGDGQPASQRTLEVAPPGSRESTIDTSLPGEKSSPLLTKSASTQ